MDRPWHSLPVLVAVLALSQGCGRAPAPEAPAPPPAAFYHSAAVELGVRFDHAQSRARSVNFLPETLGPGVASCDFDGDGRQDLFFVQGSGHADGKGDAAVPASHLYRNASAIMDEVGAPSGANLRGWGQAVLACDWNNDGYADLFITSYREPVALLTGNGDGTFLLTRGQRGLPGGQYWWSSATALDQDRDGLLDLYLGTYVNFGPDDWNEHPPVIEFSGLSLPQTMAPSPYAAEPNCFLRNRGDGSWADRTAELKLADPDGRTMAALAADLDRDGWTDLFVANDVSPCALFRNAAGAPEDIADRAMVSESRGSMGLALGDPDRDAGFDILCSHWVGDIPAYYKKQPAPGDRLIYQDVAGRQGMGGLPRDLVGWAIGFTDVDLDGMDDVVIVNGHTSFTSVQGSLTGQPATLLLGKSGGRFELFVPQPGSTGPLAERRVGRGAAFTDLDNDGRKDVAVGVNNGPAEVWRNTAPGGNWVGALLVGTTSSRDPIGATIAVADGAVTRHAQRVSGDSFFSTSDARVVFGLGSQPRASRMLVRWPSGRSEVFEGLPAGGYHRLVEGAGRSQGGETTAR